MPNRTHPPRPRPPSRDDLTRLTDALAWRFATERRSVYEVARRAAWNLYRRGDFHGAVETARKALQR